MFILDAEDAVLVNQYIDNGDSWDDLLLEGFVEPDAVAEAFRAGSPELRKRISTCRDMML